MWELALAGGGTLATGSGFSLGAVGGSVMTALGATTPAGWAVIGTIAVVGVISIGIKYAKTKQKTKSVVKERKTSPIGRRNTYNSRKKAKEAAKRAGGGKEPRHDPNGHKDDR